MGGTYYFCNEAGARVAIVKPCDEEPFAPNNPKACPLSVSISTSIPSRRTERLGYAHQAFRNRLDPIGIACGHFWAQQRPLLQRIRRRQHAPVGPPLPCRAMWAVGSVTLG